MPFELLHQDSTAYFCIELIMRLVFSPEDREEQR